MPGPVGASRLGYWFRRQSGGVDDRSQLSNHVLIVWDPESVAYGRYSSDVNPADIATAVSNRVTALGLTPHTISSYSSLSSITVNDYCQIWDVGYDTMITSGAASIYSAYLQSGGSAFIMGENGVFITRDGTVENFIDTMGGNCTIDNWDPNSSVNATVAAEFLLANSDNSVTFDRPGRFTGIGTGTAMAYSGYGTHAAVWKTGSLSVAPTGAIASVLDVNVFSSSFDSNFVDNLSISLNKV